MNRNLKIAIFGLIIVGITIIILLEITKKQTQKAVVATIENAGSYHSPYGILKECDQYLLRDAYEVCYDYQTKNPKWVSYTLSKASVEKKLKRINRFYEDKQIPQAYRAQLSDYKRSGYDRGHMIPNASADYTKQSQKESFYLSNMTPQAPGLNRQGWAQLEEYIRELAIKNEKLHVVTGVIYDEQVTYIGENVQIPDYLYKVIYIPSTKQMAAFLMPNTKVKRKEIFNYQVTVNDIEKRSEVDFFVHLNDEEEERLESLKIRL